MKVLYLTNLPAPYRATFFNELGKHVDLTVLYERRQAEDRDARWISNAPQTYREVYLGGIPVGAASLASLEALKFFRDFSYDIKIISGYSSPTAMATIHCMKRQKIPYILSIDGGVVKEEHLLLKKLKQYLLSGAKLYLSTGKNADHFFAHYGVPAEKIMHYHFTSLFQKDICSALPSREEKQTLREKLGIREKNMILSVGRLLPLKRYDLLFRAANALSDTELVIVGGLADNYHTKLLQKYPNAKVRFVDFMPYSDLRAYFCAADVFAIASDSDVWGMVIVEAMANGLPVIATDSCGASKDLILNNENGFVVPKGDAGAITNSLRALLASDETIRMFGQKSLEIIKEFHFEHEVFDHILAFRRFLGK